MHRITAGIVFVFLQLLGPLVAQAEPNHGPRAVHYAVRATTAAADERGAIPLHVSVTLTAPDPGRTVFEIPRWTPGSYRTRRFPDRLSELRAEGPHGELVVERISPTTWEITHGAIEEVTLHYRVDLAPNDRFMYRGDSRRCLTCEGPAIYMYARDYKDAPCWVTWDLPDGWEAWSGLARQPDGRDFAPDYDILADCPVKLGIVQSFSYESRGTRFDVVVDSGADIEFDPAPWLANLQKITETSADIFGGEYPTPRFVFLFTVGPGGGGGLEHVNSTCIGLGRLNSPTAGVSTIAHEFFHTWNVKRIRPVELGPFDYSERVRTRGLWIAEGITSYYTSVILARAGMSDADGFWRSMGRAISSIEGNIARHSISSEEASLEVWANHAPDRSLSYYTSGQVLGLLLDVEIRARTDNAKSLDDYMVALWRLCQENGRGYLPHEPAMVAGLLTGDDMRPFFDRYVSGTAVPDYERILGQAGVAVTVRERTRRLLRGVRAARGGGLMFADHESLDKVDTYSDIDPFRVAGILQTVADVAIEDAAALEDILAAAAPGDRLRVTYEVLGGAVRAAQAEVVDHNSLAVSLRADPDAPAAAAAIGRGITDPR